MNSADRPGRTGVSRLSVFLLELIIVIVFFALASAVLLQVFAKADELSDRAENLSCASAAATDAAERQRTIPPDRLETERYYYSESWELLSDSSDDGDSPAFYAEASPEFDVGNAGTLVSFTITVCEISGGQDGAADTVLYTLKTKKYYSGTYPQTAVDQGKESD